MTLKYIIIATHKLLPLTVGSNRFKNSFFLVYEGDRLQVIVITYYVFDCLS